MKKLMISAAALVLFAAIGNAQASQKQPAKATAAKDITTTKKAMPAHKVSATTASVTPATGTSKKAADGTATIKRKHNHKKTKSLQKTEKK